MAANKLDSRLARAVHVLVYTLSFVPFVRSTEWSSRQTGAFLVTLATTHFAIDSKRWKDTAPFWFDQALHVIALAVSVAIADRSGDVK